jgi:hypothetical protein
LLLQLLQRRVQLVCCYGQLLVEDELHLLQSERAGRRAGRQAGRAGNYSQRRKRAGRVGDRVNVGNGAGRKHGDLILSKPIFQGSR